MQRETLPDPRTFARTVTLLREGYPVWQSLREQTGAETVQTRVFDERVTVVRGSEAARFFFTETGTERSSALSTAFVDSLLGEIPVRQLNGSPQAPRKDVFGRLLDAEAAQTISADAIRRWDARMSGRRGMVDIVVEASELLFEAACDWVGIEVAGEEWRSRDQIAMIDGFGGLGLRQLRARVARRRTEAWIEPLIEHSRRSESQPSTPLDQVAHYRDENGVLLPVHTAAVEVINLMRPIVAISWLIGGMARALDEVPGLRAEATSGEVTPTEVAREVRRTFPFTPFLAARTTRQLTWQNTVIDRDTLLLLDVWGTHHDPRIWSDPERFDPRRYRTTAVTPYNLIAQGSGDLQHGYRSAGEDVTLAVLSGLVDHVARLRFKIVGPELKLNRMPPKPHCFIRLS